MRGARGVVAGLLVLVVLFGLGGAQPSPGSGGPAFSLGDVRGWLRDSLAFDASGWSGWGSDEQGSAESTAELALPRQEEAPAAVEWPEPERVGELVERRTANGRFFELSDGRVQAEISGVPVHYRDGTGVFRPIDTTVGDTSRSGFAKGNATNTFTSLFGDSTDRLVRFEVDGRHVELGLAGPARAVSPVVDGSTVTYAGVAGGADLVYEVTPRELREEIVLAQPPARGFSLRFTVRTGGVDVVQRADGSIGFVPDDGGEPVFVIPAPYMFDSAADPASPVGKGYSDQVWQTVVQRGSTATVTIVADAGWLADPGRVYPVTIDPTIRIQPVPTDAQDVEIYSGDPTRNYNDTYQLKVGTDATDAWRTLVRFPLTGVPAGTQIDDARLELYYDQSHFTWEHDVPLLAHRVTAPWDESTATWANMASNFASQPAGNLVTVDDGSPDTSVVGTWPVTGLPELADLAVGDDYRYNQDAGTGDTHTWVPTITEDGDYQVQVHFVSRSDRASNAPYTVIHDGGSKTYLVDQTGDPPQVVWKTLGVHPFQAGTAGRVVLGDVSNQAVIADAVRLARWGAATKKRAISSVWTSFPVRNVVQDWLDGTQANHGFMVKAQVESTKGRGGPVYEASEFAYQNARRDYNLPKLVVTFGRPGTSVNPPTLVTATGAALSWPAYVDPTGPDGGGDDIVEYQVHRSVFQTYTPSQATLVAPVPKTQLSYQDTSATPTPADENDPLKQNFFYYMVAVKTADGQVVAGPTQGVQLPKAGRITRIFRETSADQVPDTTLSAAQPDENVNVYDGDPYVSPGNNSPLYGDARGLVKFGNLAGIPADAKVVDAQLRMWNVGLVPGTDVDEWVDVYRVTRDWNETSATWNQAKPGVAWTNPGGDFATPALSGFNGFTNDPEWETWDVKAAVETWLDTPSSNHGLLLRQRDEVNATARALLLSSEGAEPLVRPTLRVTYLQQDPVSTYHAPDTPATRMIPGDDYTIPVTVSNPTPVTLSALEWELSYRWELPDGTDATTSGNQLASPLPADLPSGGVLDVAAALRTPIQSDAGNKRTSYVLRWELRNKVTGQWLSEVHGIGSLDQSVVVEDPTSDQLGLEKFYQYAGVGVGAGQAAMVNTHAGNLTLGYNAFANPGRGLATHVRMVYNSLDTSTSSMGYGWSLAGSTIARLGSPLEFHPPGQDWPTEVTLVDGDGTSHFFTLNKHGSADPADWEYDSPAGVHLLLQRNPGGDGSRAWVMIKPDRTQFFFDADGYPSAVVDKNGNTQTFTYEQRRSANQPVKFLRYVTDPSGRQTLTLEYYRKGDDYEYIDDTGNVVADANLTNPHIIDQVRSITDVAGRRVELTYTDKGLMARLVDGAGTSVAKTFRYGYDALQGNKNVKLVQVTDPRGNTTDLAYYDPPPEPKFHWWAESITARDGGTSTFGYVDPDGQAGSVIETTVTDPESNPTRYVTDGFSRPTSVMDALARTTTLTWDADNNVVALAEPNGAVTSWTYDQDTGYPLTLTDPEANANGTPATVLTYQTGLGGHVAELASKTSPEGRTWSFGYDLVGNLTSVTDPGSFTTTYEYDPVGRLIRTIDANQHPTVFSDYHESGYPQLITDPLGGQVQTTYDDRGNVLQVVDEVDAVTTVTYDVFSRPLQTVTSVDVAAGEFITTPAPVYDPNDNVVVSTAPNGAVTEAVYDAADRPVQTTLPEDVPGGPARVATVTYDLVGNVVAQTEPLGNLTPGDPSDHVTTYAYDPVYQLLSVTDADGNQTTYDYDSVGNLIETTDARSNPTGYAYDFNHRLTTVTDAAGHTTHTEYDLDSLVVATVDQAGVRTETDYNQRGLPAEVRTPHRPGSTRVTRYAYDLVGNTTRVTSPRGTATTAEPDDFVQQTIYDPLNRPVERLLPYDPGDPQLNTPDRILYEYDPAGRVTTISAPPSAGQTVRNDTVNTYLDTGWVETTTDPWGITTSYDYNVLGQQTGRTLTSAGGSSGRTMTWDYYPDGKLAARSDDGVPVGLHVVLVDNSDLQNVTLTGAWSTADTGDGLFGFDYATSTAGTGTDTAEWNLHIPADGTYEVFARWPDVTGAATDATYTITHDSGSTPAAADQTTQAGQWNSLGGFSFTTGAAADITLTDDANGTVAADAVKLVRDTSGETDTEAKDLTYTYDVNGNLIGVVDSSSGAAVDEYQIGYDGLNRLAQVQELASGTVRNTTSYTYNQVGAPLTRTHDNSHAAFTYDMRNLLTSVSNGDSPSDPDPKVTSYTYTPRGQRATETKANGNTVTFDYWPDRALREQVETKPDATVVTSHLYEYDLNGNRTTDTSSRMDADNHGTYLDRVSTFTYDPRDRLAQVTRTDPGTGQQVGSEAYTHDANNNVISQTINGTTTDSTYDRNRLQTTVAAGVTSAYNYDPFGRLDTVTTAGTLSQRYVYDGFDRIAEQTTDGTVTQKTYDPLDRTATTTTDAGTAEEQTTEFVYLGLSEQVLAEIVNGQVTTSYQHSVTGQLLSQTKHDTGGAEEDSFYGYNPHGDVAAITDDTGDTRATYGYTAYGTDDQSLFTGVDKPDPANPETQQPYNAYRYAGQRFDAATGTYDMGFRDYHPGLNRFLTRDTFNGALADLSLTTNPWTMSRYTFAGGNPTTLIELDGHIAACTPDGYSFCSDYDIAGQPQASGSAPASNAPAEPPDVSNPGLAEILAAVYARPGVSNVVGDGTVAAAVEHELGTGQRVGGKWHYNKAADSFARLAGLLEDDRRAVMAGRPALLTSADRAIVEAESKRLWAALNAPDRAGVFTREMTATQGGREQLLQARRAIANASKRYAVASITGTQWGVNTHKGRITGVTRISGPVLAGVARTLGVAGGIASAAAGLQAANESCGRDCSPLEVASWMTCAMLPGCLEQGPSRYIGEPGVPMA